MTVQRLETSPRRQRIRRLRGRLALVLNWQHEAEAEGDTLLVAHWEATAGLIKQWIDQLESDET